MASKLFLSESKRDMVLPKKGDHVAFARFYREYEGAVTAFMRRRVEDSELAADLTMEVFAAVLVSVHHERASPENTVAWLFGIAHHKLVDAHRSGRSEDRARRQLGLEPLALEDADLERINALTHEENVLELLDALPDDQREAIRARVLEYRDYRDIANDTSATQIAIRQRVSRGLKTLRSQMERSR